MNRFFLWLLIIACLYAMGAFTLLVAGWLDRWPSVKAQVIRLGEAACTFALGMMGLMVVALVLGALGVLPPDRR